MEVIISIVEHCENC